MEFFDLLEKLRSKPARTRKKILFMVMVLLMLIIIIFWFNTLSFSPSAPKNTAVDAPAPWEVLKKTFQAGFQNIRDTF